jgi:nitrogen fixation protein FixH
MSTESAGARTRSIRRPRRVGVSASALALIAIALTGCRNSAAPSTSVSDDTAAGWTLVLTVAPDHPRMVRPATFTLHITDSAGNPVENAQVTASLNMTLMDMGKTALKFQSKGNGVYEVTVPSFDMSGPWKIAVEAVQNRIHAHKVFPVTVFD